MWGVYTFPGSGITVAADIERGLFVLNVTKKAYNGATPGRITKIWQGMSSVNRPLAPSLGGTKCYTKSQEIGPVPCTQIQNYYKQRNCCTGQDDKACLEIKDWEHPKLKMDCKALASKDMCGVEYGFNVAAYCPTSCERKGCEQYFGLYQTCEDDSAYADKLKQYNLNNGCMSLFSGGYVNRDNFDKVCDMTAKDYRAAYEYSDDQRLRTLTMVIGPTFLAEFKETDTLRNFCCKMCSYFSPTPSGAKIVT